MQGDQADEVVAVYLNLKNHERSGVQMSKAAGSVSIIGGSEGPTSIFIVGNQYREKNLIKRVKQMIRIKKYRYRENKVKRSIKAGTHTLEQTICYMKERYGMIEVESPNASYEMSKHKMAFSLVQRERIDLLPEQPKLEDFQDKDAVAKWHKELNEWEADAEAITDKLPQEVLNMDYHMFVLDKGEEGSMQVDIEKNRELVEIQYSGNGFASILKDIYLYYGVSADDITNETQRYRTLVSSLFMSR